MNNIDFDQDDEAWMLQGIENVMHLFLNKTQLLKAMNNETFTMTAAELRKKGNISNAVEFWLEPALRERMVKAAKNNKGITIHGNKYVADPDDFLDAPDSVELTDSEDDHGFETDEDNYGVQENVLDGGSIKKTNPWIVHVKKVQAKKKGMSYRDAMRIAKKTYKK